MKIYTRKGDEGKTSLIGGTRVSKAHMRIDAYGTVDELNSFMGMLAEQLPENLMDLKDEVRKIQHLLFTLGSNLAADPGKSKMKLPELETNHIEELERWIDKADEELPALRQFILPGGHPANATAHVARCVCRRAERLVVGLNELEPVDPVQIMYLNRLSDWLFTAARWITFKTQSEEITWDPGSPS